MLVIIMKREDATNQLKVAFDNHKDSIISYNKKTQEILDRYNPIKNYYLNIVIFIYLKNYKLIY